MNINTHIRLLSLTAVIWFFAGCESGTTNVENNNLSDNTAKNKACYIKSNINGKAWENGCMTLHANHIKNQLFIGYDCTGNNEPVKGIMIKLNQFEGKGIYTFKDTTDGKVTLVSPEFQSYGLTYRLNDTLKIERYSSNQLKAKFRFTLVNYHDRDDTLILEKGALFIHEDKGSCTISRML